MKLTANSTLSGLHRIQVNDKINKTMEFMSDWLSS